MRTLLFAVLALGVCAASPPRLMRGTDHFRLGMSRGQVDSVVAARGLAILSNGTAYLVCASDDPAAEYEQYSFFSTPHGLNLLWKVTIGYRLEATADDYAAVRGQLTALLGAPDADSWNAGHALGADGSRPPAPAAERAVWADPVTSIQLGARWSEAPDPRADRMLVTWVDRRIQRLVDARTKKDKPPPPKDPGGSQP